jgi:hypothetical protein
MTTWVYRNVEGGGVEVYEKGTEPPSEMAMHTNPLAGDRHYDGLRATDGSDISTRTKHREYMKRNGVTTMDDFKSTWDHSVKQREHYRQGKGGGAVTRDDIARTIARMQSR